MLLQEKMETNLVETNLTEKKIYKPHRKKNPASKAQYILQHNIKKAEGLQINSDSHWQRVLWWLPSYA